MAGYSVQPSSRLHGLLAILALVLTASAGAAATVRGIVADVRGGERLGRVQVRLLPVQTPVLAATPFDAVSNERGEFAIENVPSGDYQLIVSTVGYRLFKQPLRLEADQQLELEIALSPEAFTQRETIEVRERIFEPVDLNAPGELSMTQSEIKNLGSVLADDPLRAVQSLPGVATGDDFDGRFALRGAAFRNIGIYLDGLLLHEPFHTVHTNQASGSLTVLNGDLVESLSLLSGGFSARYGDRTAGAVVLNSREGGRLRPTARITASASNAGVLAEGPITGARRGSWLVAIRKSYLDYIIRRTSSDDSLAFGFLDGQARVVYDLTPTLQATAQVGAGDSALDRTHFQDRLGLNSAMEARTKLTFAAAGLRYAAGPRLLVTGHVAGLYESFRDWNRVFVPLESGRYREASTRADITWYWTLHRPVEFGASLRRGQDEGARARHIGSGRYTEWERYRGSATTAGGYVQQSAAVGQARVAAGVRWDDFSPTGETTLSPRASLSLPLIWNQSLHFGWGQYTQFPFQRALAGVAGNATLSAERATHYVAAWEWQPQERTRLRVEFYDREDRNGISYLWTEPRVSATGAIVPAPPGAAFENNLRGYARGIEFLVQRRSANRLSGWVSYAWARTWLRDTTTGHRFPYDYDQPHTFTAYGSYRLRPSVNLSGRMLAGSGFPVPGFLRRTETGYALAADRNRLRLDGYQRLDLRINKTFHTARRRLTLYGEVINVLNRRNLRYSELGGYNTQSGAAFPRFDRMFPIIPSAGLVFEF